MIKKVFFYYLLLLLIVPATFLLYVCATSFYMFYMDKSYWGGVAEGKMLEAAYKINTSCSAHGKPGNRSCSSTYHPDVKYEYFVDGKHYVGTCFWYGAIPTLYSEQEVMDTIKAIGDVGDTITVYYHPENPDKSILTKKQVSSNYLISLFISFFMYGGAYLIWRFLHKKL